MKLILDSTIHELLNDKLLRLENHFNADFLFFYGPITDFLDNPFRDLIEELKSDPNSSNTLFIILNTPGGSVETVERLVNITRYHYTEVNFIIPDYAYSAGTIFCLSGDNIYMDYSSSLGPIDPQVFNGKNWVPALGYLDKVEELISKSKLGTISQAELLMLRELDLAMLRRHEQARDLTIALLKEWLVKYKFKNWNRHSSNSKQVTQEEKIKRATEIAESLGNNKLWHSHGRSIGVSSLKNILKLKIEDYSSNYEERKLIRDYNDFIFQYIRKNGMEMFFHTKKYI
ncbi:MAG: serine dehydrogenasease [Ignavibacteriaceae bacterium]|nr:serine dehydrogenasease [Ignavibacteriaceae bacterium]